MTILQEVNAYLLTKITLYASVSYDAFLGDGKEEIIIRGDPSQAAETRYLDGSRAGVQSFSYYAKSLSTEVARQQLDAIIEVLDIPAMVEITGGLSVKIEVVTSTVFVSKSESGEYIYTAGFRLDYVKGGA